MSASPREAIDYGRFAERLAAQRANQDPAKRWDLYRDFHREWGYVPTGVQRWQDGDPVGRTAGVDGDDLALVPPEKVPAALRSGGSCGTTPSPTAVCSGLANPTGLRTWITAPRGYGERRSGWRRTVALVVDPDDLRMCSV